MANERPMTDEERAMCDAMNTSSWTDESVDYRERDLDRLVDRYAPDAISMPANHACLFGHEDIRTWYAKRTGGDYDMNVVRESASASTSSETSRSRSASSACDVRAARRRCRPRPRRPLPQRHAQDRRRVEDVARRRHTVARCRRPLRHAAAGLVDGPARSAG